MNLRKPHTERQRHYDRAMSLFKRGDHAEAARLFARISSPADCCGWLSQYFAGESYLRRGFEQMQGREYEAAASSFMLASKFNPKQERLPEYLACCFARLGRFDQAARCGDRETRVRPEEISPRVRWALSQWLDGQQHAAVQTLREGLLSQPENVEWWFQLGVLLAAGEQFEAAVEALDRAVDLVPDRADVRLHLALCHAARHDRQAALTHLTEAQRLRPHDARIALYLALAAENARAERDQPPAAPALPQATEVVNLSDVEELTAIIRDEPEVAAAFASQPELGAADNVFELLAAVLDRAILQEPLRAELHYHQAQIYRRLGRRELAIASCERALEIEPHLVQALIVLAKLYRETDRRLDARRRLQQVVDLGYEYADVYYQLGCIYRDLGQPHRARQSYNKALDINSSYHEARAALDSLAA